MRESKGPKWYCGIHKIIDSSLIQPIRPTNNKENFFLAITILMKCKGVYLFTHDTHHNFVPTTKILFEYLDNVFCIFQNYLCLRISFYRLDCFDGKIFPKSFNILVTSGCKMFITVWDNKKGKFHTRVIAFKVASYRLIAKN